MIQKKLIVALRLEAVTIVWMIVEAAVSVGAGRAADSLLLVAFGVDSVIELISAGMLYHRLSRESRGMAGEAGTIDALERKTATVGGYLLFGLAIYVVCQSAYGILYRQSAESSWWGIGITLFASVRMPLLAKAKLRIADEINSRALRTDAIETLTCGYLARITLLGLLANAAFHWWWLDSVCALVLVPFLIKEGREAIQGESCCGCGGAD